MIVDDVRHTCGDDTCELSAHVQSEAWACESFTLWYRVPATFVADHDPASPDCSPFVAGLLPWCLRRAEPLRIEGWASARLLAAVPLIADVYHAFWPELLSPVPVTAAPGPSNAGAPVVSSFFTRGVDSWYTALSYWERPQRGRPLTHLVYVPSVDFMLDDRKLARTIESTTAAATAAGFTPVVAETNLRRHTERFLHWGHYHGAALASVALALGGEAVLVPSSGSYGYLMPEGSHPVLDPLWSTEVTEIVHHGAEATRWDKVRYLRDHPAALGSLKICFEKNTEGNCGECPKCLFTMTMLAAAGVLEHCPFDQPLRARRVASVELRLALLDLMNEVVPELPDRWLALAWRAAVLRDRLRRTGAAARAGLRTLAGRD